MLSKDDILSRFYFVRFFEKMCTDIFGPRFNEAMLERGVMDTNTYYGSTDIQVGDNHFVKGNFRQAGWRQRSTYVLTTKTHQT
jgi:hypothetical protein